MERPWVVCGFVVVGGGWIRVDVDRRAQRRRRVVVVGSAVGRILGQVAEVALRSRLQQCDEVKARVDAELGHILAGSVPYVLISGKKWRSPLRLTCQSLQMQVSRVDIDTDALLRRRLIVLKRPVRGNAKIVFNGADFGNFLVHPLLRSAPLPNNTSFDFLNRPAKIHKGVSFSGKLRGTSTIFHFQLLKSSTDNTTPLVIPSCKDPSAIHIAEQLGTFFTDLCIHLDGTDLTYANMTFKDGFVSLSLNICVHHFPSPTINF